MRHNSKIKKKKEKEKNKFGVDVADGFVDCLVVSSQTL